jgi:hypothetical protein
MRIEDVAKFCDKKILESPQVAKATAFGLNDGTKKYILAQKYLNDKNKIAIEQYGNDEATLYELPYNYVLIKHPKNEEPYLIYMMQFKLIQLFGRQCVQQTKMWRDNTEHLLTGGLATKIFFNHLLYKYQTAISDDMQTPDGSKFWVNRIANALTMKEFYVYYVHVKEPFETVEIKDANDLKNILTSKQPWGHTIDHAQRRFVITSKPL